MNGQSRRFELTEHDLDQPLGDLISEQPCWRDRHANARQYRFAHSLRIVGPEISLDANADRPGRSFEMPFIDRAEVRVDNTIVAPQILRGLRLASPCEVIR